MDPTQAFDPNRTVIGSPDANRTQAMTAPPMMGDPNRTTAFAPPSFGIQVSVTPSRPATMANGPAREQFLIEITAPNDGGLPGMAAGGTRTPINLCLVIDRSGSMEGPPLEYAKQACAHVIDLLGPQDLLSIVVFDDTAEILMPPQRMTNRDAVKAGLSQLTAGSTTNIYDALTLAASQVSSVVDPGRASRIVFLSDGDPTSGIKDFSTIVQNSANIRTQGVTCTFLGFGPDYNEELLASMAKKSGGNYYYIAQPHLIPEVFRTELARLMTTSLTGATLSLKFARWVELKGLTGHTLVPGQREAEVVLADLERGSSLQVVVDLEYQNHPLGHYRVASGRLSYADLASGKPEVKEIDFLQEFTAEAARFSAPVDPRVAAAAQVSLASRAVERTIMGLKTQAITAAVALQDLQKTQMLLVSQGRTGEAQEVTMAIQAIQRGDQGAAEKTLMGAMVHLDQGKSPQ